MKVSDKYYKCFVYKTIVFSFIVVVVVGVFANCFRRFSIMKIIWSLVKWNQTDLDNLDHPVITHLLKKTNKIGKETKKQNNLLLNLFLVRKFFYKFDVCSWAWFVSIPMKNVYRLKCQSITSVVFLFIIKRWTLSRGHSFFNTGISVLVVVVVSDTVIIVIFPVVLTKLNTFPQALLGFVDLQGMLDKRVRITSFLLLLQHMESSFAFFTKNVIPSSSYNKLTDRAFYIS